MDGWRNVDGEVFILIHSQNMNLLQYLCFYFTQEIFVSLPLFPTYCLLGAIIFVTCSRPPPPRLSLLLGDVSCKNKCLFQSSGTIQCIHEHRVLSHVDFQPRSSFFCTLPPVSANCLHRRDSMRFVSLNNLFFFNFIFIGHHFFFPLYRFLQVVELNLYSMTDGPELLPFGTLGELSHISVDGCGDGFELFHFCEGTKF